MVSSSTESNIKDAYGIGSYKIRTIYSGTPVLAEDTQALCLLFPSLYEGFGFPILEAMACGTSVITSNISSMPEVAGDAAVLVNPYNVDALAEAMHSILTDKDLKESLVKKGLERVRQFSWEKCAEETIRVYESL